jgi:hypothetical protein
MNKQNFIVIKYHRLHCFYIFQFDAVELDEEIVKILKNQVANVVKFLGFGFLGRWEPEVDALLRFIIWKVCMRYTLILVFQIGFMTM